MLERNRIRLAATVSMPVLVLLGSGAQAQTGAASSPVASSAAAEDADGLAEIIVTAQKRSQRLSDVGMTISAFSGDTLKTAGVASAADLPQLVPGLTYARSNTGLPVYTLRGVGFYETSLSAYPAVTVYVDEAPLAFPLLTNHTGLDLERVEVLKGPQGILFGQNSTGGAINFIAAKPTSELHYGADLSYGRFNRAKLEAFVSGPLSPTLKGRIAGSVERGDAWQYSYTRNDELGKVRSFVGRLLLDWQPTDRLNLQLSVNGWIDKSDPQAAQYFKLSPQLPPTAALLAYPIAPERPRAADWGIGADRPNGDQDLIQTSLRGEWQIGGVTLTSLTSYVRATRDDQLDPDGMAIQGYTLLAQGKIKDFYQELRIANGGSEPIRYTFGANYEYSDVFDNGLLTYADSTIPPAFGFARNGLVSDQQIRSGAAFGNVEADLTSRLTVKAGLRYTKVNRKFSGCTYDPGDGAIAATFTFLSSLLRGTPTPAIQPGECTSLDINFLPARYIDNLKEDNLSWRAGIDFKPSANTLLYVNIAKGYKAGSFPNVAASSNVQFLPVVQESVVDYEAGFKLQLADRRVAIDGAVFYYDYRNKQLRAKYVDQIFGILDKLDNIPKSTVRGAEISVAFSPIPGLQANLAATYLDGKVDRYTGVSGAGVTSVFDDTRMPFAPRWNTNAVVDYEWNLGASLKANLGAGMTHNSATFSVVGNDPDSRIKAYTLIDLRAGLGSASDSWKARLFIKNLTNEYYWTNSIVVYDQRVRYAGQPRTYGVSLSYRY
jgi:iron complex outermembrane recepter protein